MAGGHSGWSQHVLHTFQFTYAHNAMLSMLSVTSHAHDWHAFCSFKVHTHVLPQATAVSHHCSSLKILHSAICLYLDCSRASFETPSKSCRLSCSGTWQQEKCRTKLRLSTKICKNPQRPTFVHAGHTTS